MVSPNESINNEKLKTICLSDVNQTFPEHLKMYLPPEPTNIPVKRLHSRHRRFIAPGAAWQLKAGFRINFGDVELELNLRLTYEMDYLFGGTVALASRIAANNAAQNASVVVFDATRAQLNALLAAGLPLPSGRKKRFVGTHIIWKDSDLQYNMNINYPMDYLFGGTVALASRIAANTAAANASAVVFDTTRATLNALLAAGLPLPSGRKKRSASSGTSSLILQGLNKRSVEDNDAVNKEISNILTRTLADDQLEILKRVEDALDRAGLSGRQCVLRTVCELKETPINEWSIVGEMIHNVIMPKKDNLTDLDAYRKAEAIGEEHGDCWSFYPECPFSIFNVIPDVYTKDDQVQVTFEDFSAGSSSTKEHPEFESGSTKHYNSNGNDKGDDKTDDYSDDELELLLKQFGGTSDDVKEFQVDLDLTKP